MDNNKSPRTVIGRQTDTAQEPKQITAKGDTQKGITQGEAIRLYCCLPCGDHYSDQPYNLRAKKTEARARAWIADNPAIWSQWLREVRVATENKRRWSCQELVEISRAHDHVDKHGNAYKINNDLRPAFARILCEQVPNARNYVELRTSVFERAYLERKRTVCGGA